MWMLSTKMMPAVGALVPIYGVGADGGAARHTPGIDHRVHAEQLPSWYGCFIRVPRDTAQISKPARMDGATVWQEFRRVLLPLGMGGLFSTGLLCLVLGNEAFWSLNLARPRPAPWLR